MCFWLSLVCQAFSARRHSDMFCSDLQAGLQPYPDVFLLMAGAGVQCGPARIALFGTEVPTSHTVRQDREPSVRATWAGPQGECKPLGRDKNWLTLSFYPSKCQQDLWREWAGPLAAWLPLELYHRYFKGKIAGRQKVSECRAGELLFASLPCLAVL